MDSRVIPIIEKSNSNLSQSVVKNEDLDVCTNISNQLKIMNITTKSTQMLPVETKLFQPFDALVLMTPSMMGKVKINSK